MKMVCFILIIMLPFSFVYANDQGDALHAFKVKLDDPDNVLQSWNPTLINPCTWFHVRCDDDTQTYVIRVDLGSQSLAGPLVPALGSLSTLQYLELYNNKINGSIPAELGNLTNLVSLDLYDNDLTGSIPQELGNLKNLRFLRLYNNKLSGPVPEALTNLQNLKVVDISGNPDLCGPLTDKPCPLDDVKWSSLQLL